MNHLSLLSLNWSQSIRACEWSCKMKLKNSWTRLAALQDLGKCLLKVRDAHPACGALLGTGGEVTVQRRTQTQANTRSTENGHSEIKPWWFSDDWWLSNKALNLSFNLQLSQLLTSMSSCVHSPHSKWTSLCFGRPKTLGGRHWPGAMLSVRAGRLSEHCRRKSGREPSISSCEFTRLLHTRQILPSNQTCCQQGVTYWMCIT